MISGMFDRLFHELEHCLKDPLKQLEKETSRLAPLIAEAVEVNDATESLC